MTDKQLEILNKAYLAGEYDLKRYRELREEHINAMTGYVASKAAAEVDELEKTVDLKQNTILKPPTETDPTLKIPEPKRPPTHANIPNPSMSAEKHHRGPSFLQFLWVSIAILLFIYMYTATID